LGWHLGLETAVRLTQTVHCSRKRQIKRGLHATVGELEAAISEFIKVNNQNPKPFVWTKTADQILASIARFASDPDCSQAKQLCKKSRTQETELISTNSRVT
jgi:hypothetical protein